MKSSIKVHKRPGRSVRHEHWSFQSKIRIQEECFAVTRKSVVNAFHYFYSIAATKINYGNKHFERNVKDMSAMGCEKAVLQDWLLMFVYVHNQASFALTINWKCFYQLQQYLLIFKWAIPGLFFVYFRPFSNKHQYTFTTN